jgi:hypothetical protein
MNLLEWRHNTSLSEAKTMLLELGISDQVPSVRQRRFFYGLARVMTGFDDKIKGTKVTRERGIRVLNILSKRIDEESQMVRDRNVSSVVPKGKFSVVEKPASYHYVYQTPAVYEETTKEVVELDKPRYDLEMQRFEKQTFQFLGKKFETEHRRPAVFFERDENEQYRTLLYWHNHQEYVPTKERMSPQAHAEEFLSVLNRIRKPNLEPLSFGDTWDKYEPHYREQIALRKEYKRNCFAQPINPNLDMTTKNPKFWRKNIKKKFTEPIPFQIYNEDYKFMGDRGECNYMGYRENYEEYLVSQKEVAEQEEQIYQECVSVTNEVINSVKTPALWHSKEWVYPAKTIKIDKMCADTIKEYMKRSDYRYMKYMKYNQTIKMVKKDKVPLGDCKVQEHGSNSTGKSRPSSYGRRLKKSREMNDKLTPEEQDILLNIHENWEQHETEVIKQLAEDASRTLSLLKHRKDYQKSLPTGVTYHREDLPSATMVPSYMRKFVRDAIAAITGENDFQESRSKRSLAYHKVRSNYRKVFKNILKSTERELGDYILEYEQEGNQYIVDLLKKRQKRPLSEEEKSGLHASLLVAGHRKDLLAFMKKK